MCTTPEHASHLIKIIKSEKVFGCRINWYFLMKIFVDEPKEE